MYFNNLFCVIFCFYSHEIFYFNPCWHAKSCLWMIAVIGMRNWNRQRFYSNWCHFLTKKDSNTRLAPNTFKGLGTFKGLKNDLRFYIVFWRFIGQINHLKLRLFFYSRGKHKKTRSFVFFSTAINAQSSSIKVVLILFCLIFESLQSILANSRGCDPLLLSLVCPFLYVSSHSSLTFPSTATLLLWCDEPLLCDSIFQS